MDKLARKVALVTGGTSGIGAAASRLFASEGATVIATGMSGSGVSEARAASAEIEYVQSNIADPGASRSLVEQIQQKHGRIDILFLNAGIARDGAAAETAEDVFDQLFDTNVRGPYFLLQTALPLLSEGASVILTSTSAVVQPTPGLSAYSASKAALYAIGRTVALELAPKKIRVNTTTPGPINTPIGGKMGLTPEQMQGFGAMIARAPLGRAGEPDDVAQAALYLASDDSKFVTGTDLRVDGGITLL